MSWFVAGTLGAVVVGCAAPGPVREHWSRTYDAQRHGVEQQAVARHFNLHRGRWWNYYARGRWFLELGHTAPAAADFRRAIGLRPDDKRGARSYGMHFWDYFPRRELGIALFREGRFAEAARELAASLAAEDSAAAKFYLNKARAAMLKRSGADQAAPVIRIAAPAGGVLVNRPTVGIRGSVTDDRYIDSISVGGRRVLIELAARRVEIEEHLRLAPGSHVVTVSATDLVGRTSSQEVKVTVDVSPPLLFVRRVEKANDPPGTFALELAALDDIGLGEIRAGSAAFACGGAKRKTVRAVGVKPGAAGVAVSATDRAGNVTAVVVDVAGVGAVPAGGAVRPPETPPAAAFLAAPPPGDAKPGDATPPRIVLGVPKSVEPLTTTDEFFVLSGRVDDSSGVASLAVNEQKLPFLAEAEPVVAFSRHIPLKVGPNRIDVVAADRFGNRSRRTVRIERKPADVFQPAARYALALMPLREEGTRRGAASRAYNAILAALLAEPARFNVVERKRIREVLLEQKLAEVADRRTALRVGRLTSADGMLFGEIEEGRDDLTVALRFVDSETAEVLFTVDAYCQTKAADVLRQRMRELVLKIERLFPLVRANVTRVDRARRTIYVDAGRNRGLRQGMKLLLYRERGTPGRGLLAAIKEEKGLPDRQVLAKIADVGADWSSAELPNASAGGLVQTGDRAITK